MTARQAAWALVFGACLCGAIGAHAATAPRDSAGRALWWRRPDIAGVDEARTARLRRLLRSGGGATTDFTAIEADIARVLRAEGDDGHPLARVVPEVLAAGDTAQVILRLDRGPLVRFGALEVSGARVTRPATVARWVRLRAGAPYSASLVQDAEARLLAAGLFTAGTVRVPLDSLRDGVVPVRITVREPSYTQAEGAVGFLGSGRGLAGRLALTLGNIAGSGATGAVRWDRGAGGVTDYALDAGQPWIGRWPVGVRGRVRSVTQDTLSSRADWTLRLEPVLATAWRGTFGVAGTRGVGAPSSATRSSTTQLVAGLRHTLAPAGAGLALDGELAWGTRTDRAGTPRTQRGAGSAALTLEARAAFAPAWRLVARGATHDLLGGDAALQTYDVVYAGGARSIRGFRERQFAGTELRSATLELRYLLDDAGSRLDAFCDAGWIRDRSQPGAPRATPTGAGVGVWTAGPGGVVGIEYGVPLGSPGGAGQLHLALETRF